MLQILNDRFSLYENFELINEDVLKVNLKELIKEQKEKGMKYVKIVANLPYYITTPIIMKLLEEELEIDTITVMIQKEVAERLIATPGDKNTGSITYSVYYYATSEAVLEVPNNSFIPEPEVTSQVIKLNIRDKKEIAEENKDMVFRIIKAAFLQRRKTLVNGLVNANILPNKTEAATLLKEVGIDEGVRGEKLTIFDFEKIAKKIK